jgi:hypothetical protein
VRSVLNAIIARAAGFIARYPQIATAYQPPRNGAFCRSFSFPLVIAVGAGGIFCYFSADSDAPRIGGAPSAIVRISVRSYDEDVVRLTR